jgi:hypothetical protein
MQALIMVALFVGGAAVQVPTFPVSWTATEASDIVINQGGTVGAYCLPPHPFLLLSGLVSLSSLSSLTLIVDVAWFVSCECGFPDQAPPPLSVATCHSLLSGELMINSNTSHNLVLNITMQGPTVRSAATQSHQSTRLDVERVPASICIQSASHTVPCSTDTRYTLGGQMRGANAILGWHHVLRWSQQPHPVRRWWPDHHHSRASLSLLPPWCLNIVFFIRGRFLRFAITSRAFRVGTRRSS